MRVGERLLGGLDTISACGSGLGRYVSIEVDVTDVGARTTSSRTRTSA